MQVTLPLGSKLKQQLECGRLLVALWGLSSNSAFFLEVTYIMSAHNSLVRTSYLALPKQNGSEKCNCTTYLEGGTGAFQEQHC